MSARVKVGSIIKCISFCPISDGSRSDAAAELDALMNKKKLNSSNSLNNSSDC